jgi:two-component SAPR family response regulator
VEVRCFGAFEVLVDGRPVQFGRSKSKELFAYLVDRRGAICTYDMVIGALWPDRLADAAKKSMVRTLGSDISSTLEEFGVVGVVERDGKGGMRVDPAKLDCDYYRYLEGDPQAIRSFVGQYMQQYDFAEETALQLSARL